LKTVHWPVVLNPLKAQGWVNDLEILANNDETLKGCQRTNSEDNSLGKAQFTHMFLQFVNRCFKDI
jgi:hypothetical protein